MKMRVSALLIAVGAVVLQNGCGDSTSLKASFSNLDDTLTLYALNGTPQSAPSALVVRNGAPSVINPGFSFDVAFDITPTGDVEIFTVRKIANELIGVHRVGLQQNTGPFDEILKAPTTGYVYDSLLVVPPGRNVIVQVTESTCNGALLGINVYGKMRADSVNITTRAIYLHVLSNPNCGFRSLVSGVPKD